MLYKSIQGTQLQVSELCLGTGNMGGGINQEESFKILDTYLDHGGNFIDTAKIYCDWLPGERSASEKTIGRWFASGGKRQKIVLATKGAHPELSSMHIPRLSPQEIVSDIQSSLQHLGTDYIDIYWLHRDDPNRPIEEIIETLHAQVTAGNIRFFAVSNWGISRIQAGIEFSRRRGISEIIASQILWNLALVDYTVIDPTLAWMDKATWEYHRKNNFPVIPYSSQANGIFQKIASGIISQDNIAIRTMYPFESNYRRYLEIKKVSEQMGFSITQVILAFLLSQPFPVVPIIGPNHVGQLLDSMTAAGCRLNPNQLTLLSA